MQPPLRRIKSIDQWQAVATQIRALPQVQVVAPVAGGSALVERGSASRAIPVVGIEPDLYYRIVDLNEKIVRGKAPLTGTDILIGTELASDLGVDVGDKLRISAANGAVSTSTIAGVFDLGNKGANQRSTFMALHTAQSLLGLPGGVPRLEVTVRDVYAAEVIAQRITAATGVEADSWIETSAQFFAAISAQTTANTSIRCFVGLSVAFGIASVLVVSVVQKSREIGILRAMGISQRQILRVFLLQGGLLGLGGSVVGCAIGAVALVLWQRWARNADGEPLFHHLENVMMPMLGAAEFPNEAMRERTLALIRRAARRAARRRDGRCPTPAESRRARSHARAATGRSPVHGSPARPRQRSATRRCAARGRRAVALR